jgi:type III secretory pathway lipoprotein EscJ
VRMISMADFEELQRTQHEAEANDTVALLHANGIRAQLSVETSCVTEFVVSVQSADLTRADAVLSGGTS